MKNKRRNILILTIIIAFIFSSTYSQPSYCVGKGAVCKVKVPYLGWIDIGKDKEADALTIEF